MPALSAASDSSFHFHHEGHEGFVDSKDISLHADFEFADVKVEHEACRDARKLHGGQNLGLVDWVHFLNAFEFDDQSEAYSDGFQDAKAAKDGSSRSGPS